MDAAGSNSTSEPRASPAICPARQPWARDKQAVFTSFETGMIRSYNVARLNTNQLPHGERNHELHVGAGVAAVRAGNGCRQAGVGGGGNGYVRRRHRQAARRIKASPTRAVEINFGPGVQISVFFGGGLALVAAHKTSRNSHRAA